MFIANLYAPLDWTSWHIQRGETPLKYAADGGHVEAVHILLDSGATINKVRRVL